MSRDLSLQGSTAALIAALLAGCTILAPANKNADPAATAATRESPPAPGSARSVAIPAPVEKTLANGLRVIVVQRGGTPLVTSSLTILSGGEVDPAALPGLADFTANLLTQGTKTRSAPQIARVAEALGGSLSASAGWDMTTIGITVTTPKAAAALALLADVVRNPVFAKAEVERQRAQALDNLSVSLSQPRQLASLVAARVAFGAAPYGHARLGTPASLARIRPADLMKLHATYYRPDNAVLIFAGDLDSSAAFALAEKSFGSWRKPATKLAKSEVSTPNKPPSGRVVVVDLPDAGQAAVAAVRRTTARSAGDYYPGVITNAVLGGGYSARLNSEIRIKRGLSYGAGSRYSALRDGGSLLAIAQTKNASATEVVELMRAEIKRLGAEPVSATELAARKASLIGGYSRELETTAGLAGHITELVALGVDLDEINRTIASAEAVTAEQVRTYATTHLGLDGVDIVVVGDARQFADALRKNYPDLELIPSSALDLDGASLKSAAAPAPSAAQKAPG